MAIPQIPANTIPAIYSDPQSGQETPGFVDHNKAPDLLKSGSIKLGSVLTAPDGTMGIASMDKVHDLISTHGFKIGQPSAQGGTGGDVSAGSLGREASLGLASGAGLPETQHASDFSLLPGLKQIIAHPLNSADLLGEQINAGRDAQFAKAKKDYQAGGVQGKTAAALDFLGGAIPLLGPAAMGAGSEIEQGVHSGDPNQAAHGFGQAAGILGTLALGTKTGQKLTGGAIDAGSAAVRDTGAALKAGTEKVTAPFKSRVSPEPEVAITRAINPKDARAFQANVQTSLPEISAAVKESGGSVGSVNDLSSAITSAKKNVWKKVQQALGPNNDVLVDGNQIADGISGSIDKRTATQNPGLAKKITQIADTYRKPMSIADIEGNLESVNNELNAYYAKNKINQAQAKGDPRIAYKLAEADRLRNVLDQQVNNLPEGQSLSQLKQSYGALRSLQSDVFNRQLQLARKAAAGAEPITKLEKVGSVVKPLANLRLGDAGVNLYEALANKSPDELVAHAFNKYSGPVAPPAGNLPQFFRSQVSLPKGNSPSNKLDFLRPVQREPQSSVTGLGARGEAGTLVRLKGLLPAPTETAPTPGPSPENLIDVLDSGNAARQLPGGGVIRQPLKFLPAPQESPDLARTPALPIDQSPPTFFKMKHGGAKQPYLQEGQSAPALPTKQQLVAIDKAGLQIGEDGKLVSKAKAEDANSLKFLQNALAKPEKSAVFPDRRLDTATRKLVSQMSPDEMRQELLASDSLDLPNRRAFLEEEAKNPSPAISMSDADGLKAFNDRFGYSAGNELLKAKAEALKEAGLDAYHDKGDEFFQRDGSPADLQNKLNRARGILRNKEITIRRTDGTIERYKGADFSYGVGKDLSEAETNLKQHKASREAHGERARGELRGIIKVAPGSD